MTPILSVFHGLRVKPIALVASDDPVRAAVAGCNGFYGRKAHAICAVRAALAYFGYRMDCDDYSSNENLDDGIGYAIVGFGNVAGFAGYALFSWRADCNGRLEFDCAINTV